jgi:hypothetical protein
MKKWETYDCVTERIAICAERVGMSIKKGVNERGG